MIAYLNYAEDSGPWVSVLPKCKPVSWAQAMEDIDFAGEKVEMEMVNFMACSPCKGEGSVAIPFFDDYRDEIKNMFDIHKVIKGCSKISLYLQPQPGALAYEIDTSVHIVWNEIREDATYTECDDDGIPQGDMDYSCGDLINECLKGNKSAVSALARIAFIPMMEQWVKSGDFKEAFERLKEYYNA